MKCHHALVVLTLVLIPRGIKGQVIRLGSDSKRTIEITTTGKISVVADSAVVKLGFAHVAESKNAAYSESVRMGNRIVRTLLNAGMSTEDIQTESLNVGQEESRRNGGVAAKPQYIARQGWRIRVTATDAQRVVDLALAAGANSVEGVEWSVADPQALQEKADAAALTRAREIAERVAAQAGVKLGELVTIINGEQSEGFARFAMAKRLAPPPPPAPVAESLRLFPGKIEREETITVIFAIAQQPSN
jgi:uncharacterized protein YggE